MYLSRNLHLDLLLSGGNILREFHKIQIDVITERTALASLGWRTANRMMMLLLLMVLFIRAQVAVGRRLQQ